MSFRTNLVRARSHIVFVLALVCGAALILYLEGVGSMAGERRDPLRPFETVVPLPVAAGIRPDNPDDEAARIAWTYFRNMCNRPKRKRDLRSWCWRGVGC